jgi:hypothetical protein
VATRRCRRAIRTGVHHAPPRAPVGGRRTVMVAGGPRLLASIPRRPPGETGVSVAQMHRNISAQSGIITAPWTERMAGARRTPEEVSAPSTGIGGDRSVRLAWLGIVGLTGEERGSSASSAESVGARSTSPQSGEVRFLGRAWSSTTRPPPLPQSRSTALYRHVKDLRASEGGGGSGRRGSVSIGKRLPVPLPSRVRYQISG